MDLQSDGASGLNRLVAEGANALASFFHQSAPRLRLMIESRLDARIRPRVDADDILQDAYVEAAKRLNEYLSNPEVPPFVWLRFLVNQQVAQAYRSCFRRKCDVGRELSCDSPEQSVSILNQLIDSDTSPSLAVARDELQSMLRSIVTELDGIDREIVCLRHFEELTNLEAAAELSISPAAASKRYVRALTRLREVISASRLRHD